MVVTDEPGYYKDGEYGIRIENQLVVQSKPKSIHYQYISDRLPWIHEFDTMSL